MPVSRQRPEIFVGAFLLVGLVLVAWLIVQWGKLTPGKREGYPIIVEMRDATGVLPGVPVRLGGVDVGRVAESPSWNAGFTLLEVLIQIDKSVKIPLGSVVTVATNGLMGDRFVSIEPPLVESPGFLEAGARLAAEPVSSIEDLAESAEDTLARVGPTLEELQVTLEAFSELCDRIDQALLTPENVENLAVSLKEFRATMTHAHEAAEVAKPLLVETQGAVDQFGKSVLTATETFESLDPVVTELEATLKSAQGLLEAIQHGDGAASALIYDPKLRTDLEIFIDKLSRNGVLLYPRDRSEKPANENGVEEQKKRSAPWTKGR
jgi:phospholipid/cholesterol/gamma-HCH transport system substrate-binding protein